MIQEEEKVNKEETTKDDKKTAEDYLDPTTKKFKNGNPGGGRKKETPQEKVIKKAQKEFIKDFKDKLSKALPKISPVLIKLAMDGNLAAIKEVNDRVMGQPIRPIDLTTGGEPFYKPTPEEIARGNKALREIND